MPIREVEYAKTLDGKLVAVESGPYRGWAFGDAVFATKAEASAADGRSAQQAYLDEQLTEVNYGLGCLVDSASPFAEWREQYACHQRYTDLVTDVQDQLFPRWGPRSDGAARFVAAFLIANTVYEELHAA